ncbi:unnamed protein product, partial [Meganyctiphanes norvegica]
IAQSIENVYSQEKNSERAEIFSKLVDYLTFAEANENNYIKLDNLCDQFSSQSDSKKKKVFYDVIIMCQSELCGIFATNNLFELTSRQRNAFIINLHTHKDPGPQLLGELTNMDRKLKERNWPHYETDMLKFKFAFSSMVWQRCQEHPTSCYEDTGRVMSFISKDIDNYCEDKLSSLALNKAVQTLKMLGNAGQIDAIKKVPESCYKNKVLPTDVRIAAFELNRRNGCPNYKLAMM